ncbi:MAG: hypothetical protein AAF773_05620 [Cyanobacteria bacterium P01_D01_bin.115]
MFAPDLRCFIPQRSRLVLPSTSGSQSGVSGHYEWGRAIAADEWWQIDR